MLRERLAARCPSLIALGRAELREHALTFDKPSVDRSGKCAVRAEAGSIVHGVLWELNEAELDALDQAEGVGQGYERTNIVVQFDGGSAEVLGYLATRADSSLVPYDWYLSLVLSGAEQQQLPLEYVNRIRSTSNRPDPKQDRLTRLQAIDALRRAGFVDRITVLERGNPDLASQNSPGVRP